jgi:hypothetical protein
MLGVVEILMGLGTRLSVSVLDEMRGKKDVYRISRKYLARLALDVVEGRREHQSTRIQIPRRCLWASLRSCGKFVY